MKFPNVIYLKTRRFFQNTLNDMGNLYMLCKLQSNNHPVWSKTLWIKTLVKYQYENFTGRDSYERVGKLVIISYVLKNKTYKVALSTTKYPDKIHIAIGDDEDITEIIKQFAGPKQNFNDSNYYTPHFFGKKIIVIRLLCGSIKTFKDNEIIHI